MFASGGKQQEGPQSFHRSVPYPRGDGEFTSAGLDVLSAAEGYLFDPADLGSGAVERIEAWLTSYEDELITAATDARMIAD